MPVLPYTLALDWSSVPAILRNRHAQSVFVTVPIPNAAPTPAQSGNEGVRERPECAATHADPAGHSSRVLLDVPMVVLDTTDAELSAMAGPLSHRLRYFRLQANLRQCGMLVDEVPPAACLDRPPC